MRHSQRERQEKYLDSVAELIESFSPMLEPEVYFTAKPDVPFVLKAQFTPSVRATVWIRRGRMWLRRDPDAGTQVAFERFIHSEANPQAFGRLWGVGSNAVGVNIIAQSMADCARLIESTKKTPGAFTDIEVKWATESLTESVKMLTLVSKQHKNYPQVHRTALVAVVMYGAALPS